MAHLKTMATRQDEQQRYQWKLAVVKSLYRRGYERKDILELFRLIDWMMTLPEDLQQGFQTEILAYEEAEKMPFVAPFERIAEDRGLKKGLEQGLQDGILQRGREAVVDILETRFSEVPSSVVESLNQLQEPALLQELLKRSIAIGSPEELLTAISELTSSGEQGSS